MAGVTACCIGASLALSPQYFPNLTASAVTACKGWVWRRTNWSNAAPSVSLKSVFLSLCSGRWLLRAFLVRRFGDINNRRGHLLLSNQDNGEMIHDYSFGKRVMIDAQHQSHGTPTFLLLHPWENKAPSMWCWRTAAACAAWKSWKSDQPVKANEDEFNLSLVEFWFAAWRKSPFLEPGKYLLSCVLDLR